MKPLTPELQQMVDYIRKHGGRVIRRPGGVFITSDAATGKTSDPGWSITLDDVRLLEAKDVLARTRRWKEEWRDERKLTSEWMRRNVEPDETDDLPKDRVQQAIDLISMHANGATARERDKAAAELFAAIVGRTPSKEEAALLKRGPASRRRTKQGE